MLEKRLLVLLVVLIAGALSASCSGSTPPTIATATPALPPTFTSAPTVDLNAVRTEAAIGVLATLTAMAPSLLPVSTPIGATGAAATPAATNPPPTGAAKPTSTRTLVPTRTFTPAPPSPTPPRLLAATLGGGGNLIGRLLYVDTGSPEPIYTRDLYFEATANNPDSGNANGAGIDSVDFAIVDNEGNTVYRHTERTPRYCSFGGDGPCNRFVLKANGLKWPDSDQKIQDVDLRVKNSTYEVDVTVHGKNDDVLFGSLSFSIQGLP